MDRHGSHIKMFVAEAQLLNVKIILEIYSQRGHSLMNRKKRNVRVNTTRNLNHQIV